MPMSSYSEIYEACYIRKTFGLNCSCCKYRGKDCERYKNKYNVGRPSENKKMEDHKNGIKEEH